LRRSPGSGGAPWRRTVVRLEATMRRDWILGFGAFSTLLVLVYADLAVALVADRGHSASHHLWRGFSRTRRGR
jgi:hypothetical protein